MLKNFFSKFSRKNNSTLTIEDLIKESILLEEKTIEFVSPIQEATTELLTKNDQFALLRQHIEEKKNEIQKLETELAETKTAKTQTETQLRNEEVLWLKLENDLQDTQAELKEIRPELAKQVGRQMNLQKIIQEKSLSLQKKASTLSDWKNQVTTLEIQNTENEKEFINISETLILTEEELTKTQILLAEKTEIEKDLSKKLSENKDILNRLDQELSENALNVMTLQESIDSKEKYQALLAEEINTLEEAIILPKKENQILTQKLNELSQTIETKAKYKTRLTERFHELEVLLKKTNENMASHNEKIAHMNKVEGNLKKKIAGLKDSIRSLRGGIEATKGAIEAKKNEILELKENYQLALNEFDELTSVSEDLNEELAIYDLLIQSRKERSENMNKKKQELQKTIENKRQRLNAGSDITN